MKSTLAVLALAIAALPTFSQSPQITVAKDLDSSGMDTIFVQEIKLWKTLQMDDRSAFKAYLSTDFLSVKATLQTRDQFVSSFRDCKIGPLNLQNHTTRAIGLDAVAISYRLHVEMTCKKESVVEDSNATTTWVRQKDNRWLAILHTESPINPAQ
jgi:hypothetical protein